MDAKRDLAERIDQSLQGIGVTLMKQALNLEWAPATGTDPGTALGWAMIANGTVSHPPLTSTNLQRQMRRTVFASKSNANASAGLVSKDALCWRGNATGLGGFTFAVRFGMSTNVTSSRAFVGLSSSPSSLMNAASNTALWRDTFGVGFDSTDPSDGNWTIIRKDASILVKEALGATEVAGVSIGLSLPQGTINVKSTAGFPTAGTISVTTNTGVQTVYYEGVTATSFTKCTGGTGVISTMDGAVALGSTTIAAGSNGQSLPQSSTINVVSTAGFASSGRIYVTTNTGNQVVTYRGTTGTSFLECSGGGGEMSTGGTVTASAARRNNTDVYDLTISAPSNGRQMTVSLINLSTGTVILNNVSYTSNLPSNTAFLYAHAEIGPASAGTSTELALAGMSLVEKRGTSLGTLEPLGGWHDVTEYGATGDGHQDDTAAINAAIQAAKNLETWNGTPSAGGRVYFPPGIYRCTGQILIDGSVSLQGVKGEGGYPTVTLFFDDNLTVPQNGLVRVKPGTSRTGSKTGGSLTISDIAVVQKVTPEREKLMTVAGILINAAKVHLHNVTVSQIQGHGIEITSTVTDIPTLDRNADHWLLSGNIELSSNVGHGLFVHGGDTSAGASVGLIDARSNGGYGVYEDSFLGNYYAAIHTTSNGILHADATPDRPEHWLCDAAAFIDMDKVPNGEEGPIPTNSKPIWQPNSKISQGELCIPTWPKNTWFLYRATHVNPDNDRTDPMTEPTWPTVIGASVPDGGIEWTCWRELGGAVSNGARSSAPGILLSNNATEYGSIYTEGDQNQVYLAAPARVPESSPYNLDARSAPPRRASVTSMPIEIQNPYAVGNHLDVTKSHTFVGLGRWGYGNRQPLGVDPDVIFRWGANVDPARPKDVAGVWLGDFLEHEFRYRGNTADGIYRYEQRWRTELDKAPGFQTWHSYQINGTRGEQLQPAAFVAPSLWIGNQMGPKHETRIGAVHSKEGKPYFADASLSGRGYFPSGSILFNKDYPANGPIGWIAKEDCGVRMAGAQGLFQSLRHMWAGLVCGVNDGGVWVALNQGYDPNASQTAFLQMASKPGAEYSTGTIKWKCVGRRSGDPNSWEDLGPSTSAIHTSDATPTTLFTWTIPDEAVSTITAEVEAIKTDGSATASYVRRVRIKRHDGVVTVGTVDTTWTDEESAFAGCDVTIDSSGITGRVRVTGIAATPIDWSCKVRRSETTHTTS